MIVMITKKYLFTLYLLFTALLVIPMGCDKETIDYRAKWNGQYDCMVIKGGWYPFSVHPNDTFYFPVIVTSVEDSALDIRCDSLNFSATPKVTSDGHLHIDFRHVSSDGWISNDSINYSYTTFSPASGWSYKFIGPRVKF